MQWIESPESSNISRFSYDVQAQVLTVEFKSGGAYNYYDVPEVIFQNMRDATSKGQFLVQVVKGKYRYARR